MFATLACMTRYCVSLAVMWLLVVCAIPASAAPSFAAYKPTDPEALAHFQAGNRYYEAGSLERAVTEYRVGRAKEDAPAFDFNLGLAFKAMGRTTEAVEHLQRFLDRAQPDGDLRASVEKKIAALDPSGSVRAELALKRAAAVRPVPSSEPLVTSAAKSPDVQTRAPPLSPPGASAPVAISQNTPVRWGRIGGWTLTAMGLAGGGVAGWLALDAHNLDNQAMDAQANPRVSVRDELAGRAADRRRTSLVVGVGSGAVLVTGLVLVLSSGGDSAPSRVGWNVGITGNGVAVLGRF